MSTAALGTSWASYQATMWNDQQRARTLAASRLRLTSSNAEVRAMQLRSLDVLLFTNWLDAHASGRRWLEAVYAQRFRPEFLPAFQQWIAQRPFDRPRAAPSPFALASYKLALDDDAARSAVQADAQAHAADRANANQSAFVTMTVIFAVAMFLAGTMQDGSRHRIVRSLMLLGAVLACGVAVIAVLRLPSAPR